MCLVVAGGRPSDASIRDPQTAQLAAAPNAVIAASLARRGGIDSHAQRGPLLFVVPVATVDVDEPSRAPIDITATAPHSLVSSFVPARSARGPPRS
ncbi:MAG TPA: hypothetical protein VFV99_01110 [Kofleriaceae bacterium]|nr:hypothetical protein [Kofleriaceae bacterium]